MLLSSKFLNEKIPIMKKEDYIVYAGRIYEKGF